MKQMNNLKRAKYTAENKNKRSKSLDLSGINADGGRLPENHFKLRLQELEELNGHLEKIIIQNAQKLAEVVETNNKFLSIIAHDLRSPFSSILGVLEILRENMNDYNKSEIENYINIAYNSVNSTLSLLDSLLVWTISQNKEKSFTPVKIKLNDLLSDEIENFNSSAIQKQISLNHSVAHNLYVTADLQMVKTILRNLISNAIKYTNTGGKITISASENKQFVEIAVKDNGIGISSEAQKNLFKPDAFHSTAGTNKEKGTGLGLLLCKEFVEIHGGNIRIKSKPGKGCEFKFTLPHYI
jgi:signal transduction histidine kinase